MLTPGKPTPRTLVLTIAATLAFAGTSYAQQETQATGNAGLTPEQEALARDFYRAEFIILERKIEPSDVNEKMADRLPPPPDLKAKAVLRHTDKDGNTSTTLDLVPRQELHLRSAADRLENSGRYRVLLAEGWYQAFPPDFQGEPLWVTAGDWLPNAGHADVQGMITIDRQRYLHVDVRLNHWLEQTPTDNLLGVDLNAETPTRPHPPRIAIEPAANAGDEESATLIDPESGDESRGMGVGERESGSDGEVVLPGTGQIEQTLVAGLNWPRTELLTWIQETRRMRSEEVHFLDSPTLGVLVFFKKIEPEDAAPLIRKLGITGKQEPQEAP